MLVKCVDNTGYPDLEIGRIYRVASLFTRNRVHGYMLTNGHFYPLTMFVVVEE